MVVADATVISELMEPSPSPVVTDWVRVHGKHELYTTSVTLAETRYGIQRCTRKSTGNHTSIIWDRGTE